MKRVEILGAGWTWGEVPAFHPDAERWGTNNVMFARYGGDFDDWTRWFDLHPTDHIQRRRPQAYDWYRRQTKPIYRWEPDPAISSSVAYPREAVQAYFGQDGPERDFWGSLSWMLALAIYEGFACIDLFWFALMNDQYTQQIPSTRYWIGQARGRGIRVTVHGESLLKPHQPLYGCEALSPALEVVGHS